MNFKRAVRQPPGKQEGSIVQTITLIALGKLNADYYAQRPPPNMQSVFQPIAG